jgi:hypothetical protein
VEPIQKSLSMRELYGVVKRIDSNGIDGYPIIKKY